MLQIFNFLLYFTFLSWLPQSNQAWMQKIDPALWVELNKDSPQEFIILLKQQADLSAAKQFQSKAQKNRFVFERLYYTASQTQGDLVQTLQSAGAPTRTLYIVNAIHSKGYKSLVKKVAAQPSVAAIIANPSISFATPRGENPISTLRGNGPEWGLQNIGAPEVWEMGYRGQGIIVGGQDTGYDWMHPAIHRQYRGNQGDTVNHNYHWYDAIHEFNPMHPTAENPCGLDSQVPCDDGSHGTHTMGTMVGDDLNGNQIGVAPEATWIGVRNMERGYGNPFSYTEGFQWFLAPTDVFGQNPNPDMAPHVITNSWYCPDLEGCNASNRAMLEMAVDNLKAAGIMVVVSAGNAGNECSTINEIPSSFSNVFAVGASDINDNIAPFSSRGPIYDADSNRIIKPDITAPGVNVRSSAQDSSYRNFSGTSMSGPHATGAIALLLSANPGLAGHVDSIANILRRTARPIFSQQDCDSLNLDSFPNNVFGHGILNIKAAIDEVLQIVSNVRNTVTNPYPLKIFPNPTQQDFWIEMPREAISESRVLLFDMNGKLLRQRVVPPQTDKTYFNLSDLSPGTYFYSVTQKGNIWTGKVILQ